MDDLNKKRLEKGQPLSTFGKEEEELNQMTTDAVKAMGYDGRIYSGPQNNPTGSYHISKWLPFGEEQDYEGPTCFVELIGYNLICVQREEEGYYLFFDHENDRGGASRVVFIWENVVQDQYRIDPFEDLVKNALSPFSSSLDKTLEGVVARKDGLLVVQLGDKSIELLWDSPYTEEVPVLKRDAEVLMQQKASSTYVLVAYRSSCN